MDENAYFDAASLVQGMTDQEVQTTWDALIDYDPSETMNGIPADEWANLVYMEICYRRSIRPENF